jgi:hypothetical protein
MKRPQFHTDPMLGDDPLDRKINKAAVTRAWILRHPYYNYRHAPSDADAEEYARRQSELQGVILSHLLN